MITTACWLATLLYLIPVLCVLVVGARRDTPAWELALLIPAAVALDLTLLATASRVMPLEVAAVVSRPMWLAGTTLVLYLRKRAPALPFDLGERGWLAPLAGGLVAIALSFAVSRKYAVWDRWWHIPLVKSLSGQHLPFRNVYYGTRLHYHFTGDMLASVLQTFSWDRIHSSLALSLAHDIIFGLTGVSLGLLFRYAGIRTAGGAMAATAAVALAGPVTLLREGADVKDIGHSTLNYLTLSFRPHVSLAGLLLVGFAGAALLRLREPIAPKRTLPILFVTGVALAVTDEASVGLVALALGVTWLFKPDLVHPRRLPGFVYLTCLAVLLVVSNLFFDGTFTKPTGHHSITLVESRMPGYKETAVKFFTAEGRKLFAQDFFLQASVWLGGLVAMLGARSAKTRVLFVFYTVLLAVSLFAFLRVEVNGDPLEGHRMVTASFLFSPLFGLLFISRLRSDGANLELRAVTACLVFAGVALSTASGIQWLVSVAPRSCETHATFYGSEDLYKVDCRAQTHARLFNHNRPTYIETSLWYKYAGCRPIFTPGRVDETWGMGLREPTMESNALLALDEKMAEPGEAVVAACPKESSGKDGICDYAVHHAACSPAGTDFVECALTPQIRSAILGKHAAKQ
jgi:hypothetical protein